MAPSRRCVFVAATLWAALACRPDPRGSGADTAATRASEPAPRPTAPESALTGPLQPADFVVASIDPEPGVDSAGLLAVLGRPDSIDYLPHPYDTAGERAWHYGSLGLEVRLDSTLHQFRITGPATATARGVRVGEALDRVRAAYGEPHGGLGTDAWRYEDDSDPSGVHGIQVRITGDRVAAIHLGNPGYENAPPPWEWARPPWMVSGDGVGPITFRTSERDLVNLLGRDNVSTDSIHIGEGEYEPATILFGRDSLRRLEVTPSAIWVRGAAWRTREGIGLGTTLARLEQLNGRAFSLSGFDWDYQGQVCSFEGGRLSTSLAGVSLRLLPSGEGRLTEAESRQISGDDCFSSSLRPMQRARLEVGEIRVLP